MVWLQILVDTINMSNRFELNLLNNLHNGDNNFKIRDLADLFISVFGKTLYFINRILDWKTHFPKS